MRLTRAAAVLFALAVMACDEGRRRHPSAPEPSLDAAPGVLPMVIPREADSTIVSEAPEDVSSTQCPGMRLLRVQRRYGIDGGAMNPRYFGRDERGRIVSLREVLLCELHEMRWVHTPHAEGINLLLWRGPQVVSPDDDCTWHAPVRVTVTPRGRAFAARERCRRRQRGGPLDRSVLVEVSSDYRELREQ